MEDTDIDWISPEGGVDTDMLASRLEHYRPRLRRTVQLRLDPRLRARADPSDILQEAFFEATERASGYLEKREVPFFVWVRFLAVQKLAQFHRKHLGAQQRDARREVPLHGLLGPQASSIVAAEVLAGNVPTPSRLMAAEERRAQVAAVLDALDESDREILALRHFEGLSNRECSHVLGLTDGGASRRYMRAARRFGEAMRALGPDDSELQGNRDDA